MIQKKTTISRLFYFLYSRGTTPARADSAPLIESKQNIYLKFVKKSLNIVTYVNITIILLYVIKYRSNISKLVKIIYILNISLLLQIVRIK